MGEQSIHSDSISRQSGPEVQIVWTKKAEPPTANSRGNYTNLAPVSAFYDTAKKRGTATTWWGPAQSWRAAAAVSQAAQKRRAVRRG
jgi:hypothetical protein